MAEINHPDHRVEEAFNMRQGIKLYDHDWQDVHTSNAYKPGGHHICITLERVDYPMWHKMHGCGAWRVRMYGTGEWTGQEKSVAMRRVVREYLNIKQYEFEWLMVRTGGQGEHFHHTWDVFTEDELRGAVQ